MLNYKIFFPEETEDDDTANIHEEALIDFIQGDSATDKKGLIQSLKTILSKEANKEINHFFSHFGNDIYGVKWLQDECSRLLRKRGLKIEKISEYKRYYVC